MRTMECFCGLKVEGKDDNELFDKARVHANKDHADMNLTDQQLKDYIAQKATDAKSPTP